MCFLVSVISLQYKQYITTWIFRIDHFMVSYLNILQNIFEFVTINSTFSCSQALLFESLQDCLPHKFLLVISISYALTTFVSSLSSSTVIVTSWNSVPSMVFWAVQITSKWFELEFPYHSIIIVATTACSTILLTRSLMKIISLNSMYTLITILLWSILIFMLQNINFQIFSVTSTFLNIHY